MRQGLGQQHKQQLSALGRQRRPIDRAAENKDRQRERNLIILAWRLFRGLRGRFGKASHAETDTLFAALKAVQAAERKSLKSAQQQIVAERCAIISARHQAHKAQHLAALSQRHHAEHEHLQRWHDRDFAAQLRETRTAQTAAKLQTMLLSAVPATVKPPLPAADVMFDAVQDRRAAPLKNPLPQPSAFSRSNDGAPSANVMDRIRALTARPSANTSPQRQMAHVPAASSMSPAQPLAPATRPRWRKGPGM